MRRSSTHAYGAGRARPGLAAATGAPVIPLGLWGTERVWPRALAPPGPHRLGPPAPVRIRVGPPVPGLTGVDFDADTERIMEAIAALLPPEAQLRRIPTADELARSRPPA